MHSSTLCVTGLLAAVLLLPSATAVTWSANVADRLQWQNNDGYCGEVSTIIAGLKFGQYASQYDMRAFTNPTKTLTNAQKNQFLVGSVLDVQNDVTAAQTAKLKYISYPGTTGPAPMTFMNWVKKMMRAGNIVTIGIYCKACGNTDYDHIVTVMSYTSQNNDDTALTTDTITIGDHIGSSTSTSQLVGNLFTYQLTTTAFIGSRSWADRNAPTDYTLPNDAPNFGIAITGPMDLNSELLPVQISPSVVYENPVIAQGVYTRPSASSVTLSITVGSLSTDTTVKYLLLKYDNEAQVPTSGFILSTNGCKFATFNGNALRTYNTSMSIMSSDKVFLRAVRDTGSGGAAPACGTSAPTAKLPPPLPSPAKSPPPPPPRSPPPKSRPPPPPPTRRGVRRLLKD